MDSQSVLLVCSLCAMLVVAGYSTKAWYRHFTRHSNSNE